MTLKTESDAIIKKIEEQREDIFDKIANRQASKNLHQIQVWLKQQINSEFLLNNVQLLAIIIDTIHQFLKKDSDNEKTSLIENCLINLINNWSSLQDQKILSIASYVKAYTKTNDADAKVALNEFIGKSGESTRFFRVIPEKLVLSCGKALSDISKTIKTKSNILSTVKLATKTGLSSQSLFLNDASSQQFANNLNKKKGKAYRIIAFDEDGIGYDVNSSYLYFKEINRLSDINLEIELSTKIKKKLLQDGMLDEELKRLARVEVKHGSYLNRLERKIKIKEFDFFASKEIKDTRQSEIEKKIRNNKKNRERKKNSKLLIPKILPILKQIDIYKKAFACQSLTIESFLFETNKDDFLAGFLKSINYEKFKELIDFSEYIRTSSEKIKQTLIKIDDFSKNLGIVSNYVRSLDSYYIKIKENFNRENISNFLEDSLSLFEQKTLALDNNYCLLDIQAKKKKIVFSEPDFLDEFILANNNSQIFKILSDEIRQLLNTKRKNQTITGNRNLKKKKSLIKRYFYFLSDEYYFTNEKFKKNFIKKIFSNIPESHSIESMKTILVNLKWWQFFLIHIGIIFLLKKEFRVRLSEALFLDLLEEKFEKISEKEEPKSQDIDELYDIKKHINSFDSKVQDRSINLNSLTPLDSRQAIVDRLKRHKEVEDLLDNVLLLSNQASSCINEFNKLKDACKRENENIPENGEIFHLNKSDVSKIHIPLKWMR
ncbi:hypothetical protein [Rickettsiella endosymbiont of Aleochara curtula]|uniref:hypothetical protein n=1 Tax=Rickettsiella endosymbiont of Aleochara curtula TaxID=3077936 RepID=UPI00313AB6D4